VRFITYFGKNRKLKEGDNLQDLGVGGKTFLNDTLNTVEAFKFVNVVQQRDQKRGV
jgi:hypothetical protein